MTRSTRAAAIPAFVIALACLSACKGDVLDFDPADSSTDGASAHEAGSVSNDAASRDAGTGEAHSGGDAAAGGSDGGADGPGALPLPDASLTSLDDTQALQLCTWVYESNPFGANPAGLSATTCTPAGVNPGFTCGGGGGCLGPGIPGGLALFWTTMTPGCCVLNLRHSPCAATTASVAKCVQAWSVYAAAEQSGGGASNCTDLDTACTDFVDSPSCDDTLFEHSRQGNLGDSCFGCMSIEAGATCPASAGDSGTD